MEKVAVDICEIEGKYVLMAIDYFTRLIWARTLADKSQKSVIDTLKAWFNAGSRPKELVVDNCREFNNTELRKLLWEYRVEMRIAGVEDHRSNRRIERAIRTMREGLLKCVNGDFEDRVEEVTRKYNDTYHAAIMCRPVEAWNDEAGIAQIRNNSRSSYARQFKKTGREQYQEGKIIAKYGEDSYLVKEGDKIFKKSHRDIKLK